MSFFYFERNAYILYMSYAFLKQPGITTTGNNYNNHHELPASYKTAAQRQSV